MQSFPMVKMSARVIVAYLCRPGLFDISPSEAKNIKSAG